MPEGVVDNVKDTAVKSVKIGKGIAGEIINKELEVIERLAALADDREVECRLKFENLTINGDTALSISFLKKK